MCGQSLNLSQNQTSFKCSALAPHCPAPEFGLEAHHHQCVREKEGRSVLIVSIKMYL